MRLRRLLSVLAWVFIIVPGMGAQGTNKTVRAGEDVTLIEAKEKIDVKTNGSKGAAQVWSTGSGTDQMFRLIYRANDTAKETTDELQYQVNGGTAQQISIVIEPNEDVFKAVSLLLLLAIVIESALAIIFNWRPFVETFNARAVRPLISFGVSYLFVETFNLDLMTTIVNSMMNATRGTSLSGKVLTALVLAGGSAGVNNLLVALGYRQKQTPETVTPKPPANKAWIGIRLDRQQAVGQVHVFLGVPPTAGQQPPLAGVIHGTSKPGIRYFFSDPGRFPGYGGHTVPVNSSISLELVGVDKGGQPLSQKWGPCTLADGAIIDLDFKL